MAFFMVLIYGVNSANCFAAHLTRSEQVSGMLATRFDGHLLSRQTTSRVKKSFKKFSLFGELLSNGIETNIVKSESTAILMSS